MEFKPLKLALSLFVLSFASGQAMAQTPAPAAGSKADQECMFRPQEITSIREPQFGVPNAWNAVYAGDGMDVFSDILPLDNQMVLAAGAFTKDKEDKVYHPLLVKFDDRQKKLWEVRDITPEAKTIRRVLKTKEGFIVAGDLTQKANGSGIYVGFFDEEGKSKGTLPIFEKGGDLDSKAMVAVADGSGYLIAAQFIKNKDEATQHGLLYKVAKSGKLLWKRSYQPGATTVFNNIQSTLDGLYIVTGQLLLENGKSAGWLLSVDGDGTIRWQHTYPRGTAASLQSAAQMKDGHYILTGKIRPLSSVANGTNDLAAWVLKTDSAGTPVWQRYFNGPYSYEAPDAIVYEDGRVSVLVNGQGADSEHRSHSRFITLSPLGTITMMEDYTEGQNAVANRLVTGRQGERLLAGYAQTSFGDKDDKGTKAPAYTFDGWLMAAPPLEAYQDPCTSPPSVSPILP